MSFTLWGLPCYTIIMASGVASDNQFRQPPPILPGQQVGIALIVANDYRETSKPYLRGTQMDAEAMVDTFSYLGYRTICKQNVKKVDFQSECERLAGYDYKSGRCKRIAVVFSGHGDVEEELGVQGGVLIMQDEEKVIIKDLVNLFKPTNNNTLVNTTRMFFIDACRGSTEECIVSRSPRGGRFITQASSEAGILIAYSTTENHKAYEGIDGGFWIQSLAQAMRTVDDSLPNILTKVNKVLNERCNRSLNVENPRMQTAQYVSQLIEDVYFLKERPAPPKAQHVNPEPSSTQPMETDDEAQGIRETLTSQGITCQYHITETPSRQPGSIPCYFCELSCFSNGMNYTFRSKQSYHNREDAKKDVNDQARESPDIGANAIFSSRSVEEVEDHTSRVDKLAEYCKSQQYRPPSYNTKLVGNSYVSTVLVPRNGKFIGDPAESIELAREKAAKKALLEMGIIKDSLKLL